MAVCAAGLLSTMRIACAAAAGWVSRARRLLEGQPASSAHGWLAIEDAKRAADPMLAEERSRAALAIAHELRDADIECMALAQVGHALVRQGRVAEGTELLDEAMTVALGGESSDPLACGDACCTTLVVCDGLADLQRATQWCEAVVDGHDTMAAMEFERIRKGATRAKALGLEVHAGHGLDLNTAETIVALPEIVELNIGHFLVGAAIFGGLAGTVKAMRAAMDRGLARR